jgi:hypothetical protein
VDLIAVRAELLRRIATVSSDWPAHDGRANSPTYAPVAVLARSTSTAPSTFGRRMTSFTVELIVDPHNDTVAVDRLDAAQSTGGWIDDLSDVLAEPDAPWAAALVNPEFATLPDDLGQGTFERAVIRIDVY